MSSFLYLSPFSTGRAADRFGIYKCVRGACAWPAQHLAERGMQQRAGWTPASSAHLRRKYFTLNWLANRKNIQQRKFREERAEASVLLRIYLKLSFHYRLLYHLWYLCLLLTPPVHCSDGSATSGSTVCAQRYRCCCPHSAFFLWRSRTWRSPSFLWVNTPGFLALLNVIWLFPFELKCIILAKCFWGKQQHSWFCMMGVLLVHTASVLETKQTNKVKSIRLWSPPCSAHTKSISSYCQVWEWVYPCLEPENTQSGHSIGWPWKKICLLRGDNGW